MHAISLHAANPGPMTGSGNWTYLIPGHSPVLIDAGVGELSHVDAVWKHAREGPATVLVTHIHPDHVSGAPALAARSPVTRFMKYPWPARDANIGVSWEALADGQHIETGEGSLEVVHTPGHSPDHVAFWHAESATAFTGDLLVLGSSVVIPASDGGVLADYLRSLERLTTLGVRRALPAHGPAIDDPLALINQYLQHRRAREQQVIEALSAGDASVDEVATRIYKNLSSTLVLQARESVLAHLEKLRDQGVATCERAEWRLAG